MIEKTVSHGPHVTATEQHRHKRSGAPLKPTEFHCERGTHETYRCPHGERMWCVGDIKPERSEIEERLHALFGCTCTL